LQPCQSARLQKISRPLTCDHEQPRLPPLVPPPTTRSRILIYRLSSPRALPLRPIHPKLPFVKLVDLQTLPQPNPQNDHPNPLLLLRQGESSLLLLQAIARSLTPFIGRSRPLGTLHRPPHAEGARRRSPRQSRLQALLLSTNDHDARGSDREAVEI